MTDSIHIPPNLHKKQGNLYMSWRRVGYRCQNPDA